MTSGTPVVISDSSTLIHLSAIGRLALLKEFFGRVVVPPAVWQEVVERGAGRAGVAEVEAASREGWIETRDVTNEVLLRLLRRDLDRGEAEVIALAVEYQADLVLLDESEARQIAGTFGLRKTGVIGVLIRAKLESKIAALRPDLDNLRDQAGFWIEEKLYRKVLSEVGE